MMVVPVPDAAFIDDVCHKDAAPDNRQRSVYLRRRGVDDSRRIPRYDDNVGIGGPYGNTAVFVGDDFYIAAVLEIAGIFSFFAQFLYGLENRVVLIDECVADFFRPGHVVAHLFQRFGNEQ